MAKHKIFLITILISILFLSILGGFSIAYFKLPSFAFFDSAFRSAQAWNDRNKELSELKKDNDEELASGEVTYKQIKVNDYDVRIATGKVVVNSPQAYQGYTLLGTLRSSAAWLIDMNGKLIHTWAIPFSKIWPNPKHVEFPVNDDNIYWQWAHLYPNGDLLAVYVANGATPDGYGLVKMDKDSNIIWSYPDNTHHFVDVGEDGKVYTLTEHIRKEPYKGFEFLKPPFIDHEIITLSPEGKLLSDIPVLDAFRDTPYIGLFYQRRNMKDNQLGDYIHANTVRVLRSDVNYKLPFFKPGYLLISLRNFSIIAVVNPESGKVVWAVTGPWRWQHDVEFTKDGNITMLDNNGHFSDAEYSRILTYDPLTSGISWKYAGSKNQPLHTGYRGGKQLLPNGDVLIMEAQKERVIEVGLKQDIVWEYKFDKGTRTERNASATMIAQRYTADEMPFIKILLEKANHNSD